MFNLYAYLTTLVRLSLDFNSTFCIAERINFQNNELRGDLSVPPHTTQEDLDFGNDEDWDAEVSLIYIN